MSVGDRTRLSRRKLDCRVNDGNPYDFEQWYFVVMEKYDPYASKPVKGIMKRHHIELSVKVIGGAQGRRTEVRHGFGQRCGCCARRR